MDRSEFMRKCNEVQEYWGDKMPMMVMEEAAELIQAISKYERYLLADYGQYSKDEAHEIGQNLIDEIGDMYISLMALQLQYGEDLNRDVDPFKPIEQLIEMRIEKKLNKKY